ncbi:hypothetical protein SBM1_00084 [Synechococcus phage S-BM1]|nr:hypothetical protein SBM1_00084 [Synechococcus phage S-BM1]
MLSFKALSEKKTKITLNPKLKDVMEKKCDKCGEEPCECEDKKKKKCPECDGKGCKHCGGTGYHSEGEGEMSEAKKKDDSYLETDFKKRQKNNEKARKDLMKGPQMKNPHFESTEEQAYVSQEEVSEESTKESETETVLTFRQFCEDRAADAKKSLDAVKKRQKVLDAHEKKTGKKLDITKTPEHKQHKMRFPGAKRTGKKVKGAKETELQQHNRRVSKHNERLIKKGPTKKEAERQKGYDAYEKKHKRGNKSVWD